MNIIYIALQIYDSDAGVETDELVEEMGENRTRMHKLLDDVLAIASPTPSKKHKYAIITYYNTMSSYLTVLHLHCSTVVVIVIVTQYNALIAVPVLYYFLAKI